ncbi:MAG: hypothetical protein LBS92_06630 [Candidatus Methanoplasma sp.]|jgi:DNA-directed RNA polymerase subunit F|nr:hypothetical protein [Candidatus Methanoplasma sp.]
MTEQYVTLAEVRDLLTAENLDRELLPSQKAAMEHAQKTAAISAENARALMAEVMGIHGVTEYAAVKIADLVPQYSDDVRAIFSKERVTLDAEIINKIIEVVSKYL